MKALDRRRGVASRGLGLVADWGFSNGIQRLFLVIHPENVASNRLAERMGFTREGVLRSYEPVKGQRPDLVSWSLLPADPRPWHQTSRSGPMPQSAQAPLVVGRESEGHPDRRGLVRRAGPDHGHIFLLCSPSSRSAH